MMRSFVGWFIRYPVTVDTLMVLILIFGFFGLKNTRSSFFPEVESRQVQVRIIFPGAAPEEVEEGVVLRIENDIKGITGIERISSVSQENGGLITVDAIKGYDTDVLLQDVKNAVDRIPQLPEGMEPIRTFKLENLQPAFSFAIVADGVADLAVLKHAARRVEQDLRSIEGISKVTLTGFPEEEIEVAFREESLRAYGLTFSQAAAMVRAANLELTGGKVKTSDEELLIRVRDRRNVAEGLRGIPLVSAPDGRIVRLGDVANVRDTWADDPARSYINGKPAVVVGVSSTVSEDILGIADKTRAYMEEYNTRNTALRAVLVQDSTIVLRQRIDMLTKNGLQGFFLVLILLALFLNLRLAFWVALSIPVAFAGMFILSPGFITINVLSLFGMILVVGILVDDGIVICESIYQEYEKGLPPVEAAIVGTQKVITAVISAVLTTVAAFSTFFYLEGRLGEFAPALAFVVIATLAFSLLEGGIILPAHVAHSKGLHRGRKNRLEAFMDGGMTRLRDKVYGPFLEWALANRMLTIGIGFFFLAVTVGAIGAGTIKTTFFPVIERDDVQVELEMVAGTREHIVNAELDRIEALAWAVNKELSAQREDSLQLVLRIQRTLGPRPEQGFLNIVLLDGERRNMRSEVVTNMIRERVGNIPGATNVSFGLRSPFGKPVSVSLRGHDLVQLNAAKAELRTEMERLPILRDVVDSDKPGDREVVLRLKQKAHMLGLTTAEVMQQVRQGFFGQEAQRVQRGEDEIKVWVRLGEEGRASLRDLEDMRIRTPDGRAIPLSELATYHIERGIRAINHLDGRREVRVEADMAGANLSSTDAQALIRSEVLPPILARYPEIRYSFEGQGEQSRKVGESAQRILPITLLIMFAIMVFALRSFWQMVMIVLGIPFALIGVGWGHWIHGVQMSLFSFFGIVALIGVMVNDSLVLLTTFNGNLKEGMTFREALVTAARSRLRPILLTTLTTVAGLLPLIFNRTFQAQFIIPMAISVAYGLMLATFVTLVVLPVCITAMNDLRRGVFRLWNMRTATPEELEPAIKELPYERLEETRG
ncbi:MAG: efflux RND transporter permease subunit [Flavobacteriales bacterium]|nr:efflux RND transporter permease subunit [Flavobacteriales bacterium]